MKYIVAALLMTQSAIFTMQQYTPEALAEQTESKKQKSSSSPAKKVTQLEHMAAMLAERAEKKKAALQRRTERDKKIAKQFIWKS